MSAADGLLINGSVNNGGASPFSQSAAFGNNRRGPQSLYNWGLGTQLGHSALDARPYSFGGRPTVKPDYSDIQIMGTFGGPLRIPGLRNAPLLFLGYQRLEDHNATTQSAIMPTVAQRGGDFSDSPVGLIDPDTGPALRRQRDSRQPHQRSGANAAPVLPAAESDRGERLQLPGARW